MGDVRVSEWFQASSFPCVLPPRVDADLKAKASAQIETRG